MYDFSLSLGAFFFFRAFFGEGAFMRSAEARVVGKELEKLNTIDFRYKSSTMSCNPMQAIASFCQTTMSYVTLCKP